MFRPSFFPGRHSETITSHIILAHAISPSPDSGHASARSPLPGPFFLPATQAAMFLLFSFNVKHVKHGNEGCCSSSTSTSISAVRKKQKLHAAGEANIAATDRLEPAGGNQGKKPGGRAWRSRACHPPSACAATNRFLVTRAAASHQHKAQATACFFFGFSASSHVLPCVPVLARAVSSCTCT